MIFLLLVIKRKNSSTLTHGLLEGFWLFLPGDEDEVDGNAREDHQTPVASFDGTRDHRNNRDENCRNQINNRPDEIDFNWTNEVRLGVAESESE